MKSQLVQETLTFLCAILSFLLPMACPAQTTVSDKPQPEHAPLENWGQATNGVKGGISVSWNDGPGHPPDVAVYVCQAPKAGSDSSSAGPVVVQRGVLYFGGEDITKSTNRNAPRIPPQYYRATNSFCGPIALRDPSGRQVPLLHPALSSLNAYPPTYSLRLAQADLMGRYLFYSGPPMPTPLMTQLPQLARFHLEDHFPVKEPGDYQLTVWPKIYKRISTTNDLCERIDVPPVSVVVSWQGHQLK